MKTRPLTMQQAILSILILWGGVTILDGKVYVHRPVEQPQRIAGLAEEEARAKWSRVRRATPDTGNVEGIVKEGTDKLDVDVTKLNGTKYNEAIVHWSGQKNNVVFVLTREHYNNGTVPDSTLYRSKDYGSTFQSLTSVPSGAIIRYYYSCPTNRSKLIFTDVTAQKVYITHDEGDTLQPKSVSFPPEHLVFHPRRQDWLLGYSFHDRQLYMSSNLGESWDPVAQYVNSRFYWAVHEVDEDDSTIHMEVQDPVTGQYRYQACARPYADCGKDVTVDPDFGQIDVDSLIVQNEYIFVQRSTQFNSSLYVSYKRGPLRRAFFPFNVHAKDFSIVNTAEHQVFIAADHRNKTVNLYLSDVTGQLYIKSLEGVVALRRKKGGFDTDLYEVRGVNGTYIVNQYIGSNARTLISFDQGGEWRPLQPPSTDISGKSLNCSKVPNCSLHIHLGFSQTVFRIPYILSDDNAPGLILAQGNVGTKLTPPSLMLFISNDAGYTWRALFEGSYNYNILDHGGAIVAVADSPRNKTNTILYSCTQGLTWSRHTFLNERLQVDGVLNEPGITTLIASIYGHLDSTSGWVIVKVNFGSLLRRKCTDDDYEIWDPTSDIKGHYCLLGQRKTYKHRKERAECFNGEDYEKVVNVTICKCVKEDYECDFGYEETSDGICQRSTWFDTDEPIVPCPEGSYYYKTAGYRKIAADKCEGGMQHDSRYATQRTLCPLMAPKGLRISTVNRRLPAPTGTKITFKLTQDKGSEKSTVYIWSFGDRAGETLNMKGLEAARQQNHTYMQQGVYVVSVTAKNEKGKSSASMDVKIEDGLAAVYVVTPHGAQVNRVVKFEAIPVSANLSHSGFSNVHFLWLFGDEPPAEHPLLTYEHTVSHTYQRAGNYTVTLEAVNSVSSILKRFTLPVYNSLETVQVVFGPDVDKLNKHTAMWRRVFADLLKRTLVEEVHMAQNRLEVSVLTGQPLKADISVLPPKSSSDEPIDNLVSKLITRVNSATVPVNLTDSDFGTGTVHVINAYLLTDKPDGREPSKVSESSRIAIIVCVPLLVVLVFFLGLFIMYQRRRSSALRRYAVLQSHAAAENEDDFLGGTPLDEDDDPPLNPDPDYNTTHRRARTDNGLHTFGRSHPLVMRTTVIRTSADGNQDDEDTNAVTC